MLQHPLDLEAHTLHDYFVEHQADKTSHYLWSVWWEKRWREQLDLYESLGWKLIAIAKGAKRPVSETEWATEPGLDKLRAFAYIQQGFNLAVVAGSSKLAILDYDSKSIPERLIAISQETLTAKTPRGFAFFTAEPYSKRAFEKLHDRFPYFDHARVNVLYELVPLSKTCTQDYRENAHEHNCQIHDYRIRDWLPGARKPMPFKDFVKRVLE